VREKIVVAGAVKAERVAEKAPCDTRVTEVERQHNRAVAKAAATRISTPDSLHELKLLCDHSQTCRKGE
jgi:hypothetical protein